ncbi:MAG: hypothetical protein ABI588_03450, partial [Arenimonas sp.]
NGLRVVDDHHPQAAEIALFHLSPRIAASWRSGAARQATQPISQRSAKVSSAMRLRSPYP